MIMLKVNSEIGKLKTVLIHEPGEEINNLTPNYLGELLFDDIPWLPLAKKEHKAFAKAFSDLGIKVVYLVDLVVEAIDTSIEVRNKFIKEYIEEASIHSETLKKLALELLNNIKDTKQLVLKTMSGIQKKELPEYYPRTLLDFTGEEPFITNPMPNLYFTRDPFAIVGEGVCLNKMYSVTRSRETIYGKYIFKYHPVYKTNKLFYDRTYPLNIEGGDILVLSDEVLIVGVSQRTHPSAIEALAKNLFYNYETNFKKVYALTIPKFRTFMHLDTVFTQLDYDKFAIHEDIIRDLKIYKIVKDNKRDKKLKVTFVEETLEELLSSELKRKISLIYCGGKDKISAAREQWSDGSNFVCVAPGEVIAYERNNITNEVLKSNGIIVHTIPSSELSRGRGGPRCMCMPLEREDI